MVGTVNAILKLRGSITAENVYGLDKESSVRCISFIMCEYRFRFLVFRVYTPCNVGVFNPSFGGPQCLHL
jgi:hypothetical protein